MPFAALNGLNVYYELHGDGAPVVLISGTAGDLRRNPRRGSGPLERHFQVLMYDQRGLGQTTIPTTPYSMADYADDCVALMDAVGWRRAHVIGISFGGMVAQHVALRHPERIDRLVLACTSSGGAGGDSYDLLAIHDLPTDERLRIWLPILDSRNDPTADPPAVAPMFDILGPALAARPLNADLPNAEVGARRQLEARAKHDVWDRLGSISAPTFVLGGRYDRQAPPENVERLASAIPGSRLQFFDGGHVFLDQDRTAWPTVIEFLGQLPALSL